MNVESQSVLRRLFFFGDTHRFLRNRHQFSNHLHHTEHGPHADLHCDMRSADDGSKQAQLRAHSHTSTHIHPLDAETAQRHMHNQSIIQASHPTARLSRNNPPNARYTF